MTCKVFIITDFIQCEIREAVKTNGFKKPFKKDFLRTLTFNITFVKVELKHNMIIIEELKDRQKVLGDSRNM